MLTVLKVLAIIIEIVFLLWFILPAFFHIFKAGNILGVLICIVALFRTAFGEIYEDLAFLMAQNIFTEILWIIIRIGWYLFIAYAVIVSACMIYAMSRRPDKDASAVILGAQVKPWGASRLLKQRIKAAEDYLQKHPDAIAVASGGKGDNEPMTEAACMLENMLQDGVDPQRILTEDRSVNTEQNLLYSIALLRERQRGDSIATVSDSYHQLRARIIVRKIDRSIRVGACNTKNTLFGYFVYPSYFVREWIAIPVEIVKKLGRPARHRKI